MLGSVVGDVLEYACLKEVLSVAAVGIDPLLADGEEILAFCRIGVGQLGEAVTLGENFLVELVPFGALLKRVTTTPGSTQCLFPALSS